MLGSTILVALIAFFSIIVPGFLFALALLRKTELNLIEISVFGFILGFIIPTALTWVESYLISFSSFFAFSLPLFEINIVIATIIGLILCIWQGAFKNFKEEFLTKGNEHDALHRPAHHTKGAPWWVWAVLIIIMLSVFSTRLQSIGITPTFFEFDPYFDMVDTQYILTYGQELLLDPSAWPASPLGTNHRVEPLIPYIEAYWYDLSNSLGQNYTAMNTTLLSLVSGVYPPIAAALLVFVIFVILYHEYNEYIGLLAAGFAATMPVLFTTFIAGEQLVENWGIFALFFFLAAYMLAVKNPKSIRLAIFAGIAFFSNFIGAHYYTVTTGVLVIYVLLQGVIDIARNQTNKDFYKMNAIVIAVITILFLIFLPYNSTLENRVPGVLGVPIVIAGPVIALLFVAFMDYVPKELQRRALVFKNFTASLKERIAWMALVAVVGIIVLLLTPLSAPIKGYLALSTKFTTPSSPLFMTVEEYIPTGFFYNFDANGIGVIGASIGGVPVLIWIVCAAALVLIALSIFFRNSKTGILYMAMSIPLLAAGFSEVKYLPHFGIAYILLFCIIIGELIYYAERNFKLSFATKSEVSAESTTGLIPEEASKNKHYVTIILATGLFFISTILGILYLIYVVLTKKFTEKNATTAIYATIAIFIIILAVSSFAVGTIAYGESESYVDAISSGVISATAASPNQACTAIVNDGFSIGDDLYCNVVPQYWLNAMAWIKQNVGPNAPRVLSWWDYGDWINWFGNSNAYIRGDNANATEDYAVAAHYVLGNFFGPSSLASFMNGNQTKYVLMDEDLISKWQALDFLACVRANQTSYDYAIAQGQAQSPPQPYLLGTSPCEVKHDPEYALIPLATLIQTNMSTNINYYCSISNSTAQFAMTYLVIGENITNQSVCVDIVPNKQGVLSVYSSNGIKLNAYIQASNYLGIVDIQSTPFVQYLMIYIPNGPNSTITNAPSGFYTSNYYKGFILGDLPGFTQVYPENATGINFVNGTYGVRIFELNNFTGKLPPVPPKPSYEHNNYSIP